MNSTTTSHTVRKVMLAGISIIVIFNAHAQGNERTRNFPRKAEFARLSAHKGTTWFFIMAGQSNMAGRGLVEPQDTIPDERILTIDQANHWIKAKEPLHFYEPTRTGLDCGLSFGKELLREISDSVTLVLLPAAIGGSSIQQWLGDSVHHSISLLKNLKEKISMARQNGTLKGILWHQGESDAHPELIGAYASKLRALFSVMRREAQNDSLPILIGELGLFLKNQDQATLINAAIRDYSKEDKNTAVVNTGDLHHKGDSLHFNSEAQRTMGKRFARAYLNQVR